MSSENPSSPWWFVALDPADGQEANPHRLARLYLDSPPPQGDTREIRYRDGRFYARDGAAWRLIPKRELQADITGIVADEFARIFARDKERFRAGGYRGKHPRLRNVTRSLVSNVAGAVASYTLDDPLPAVRPGCYDAGMNPVPEGPPGGGGREGDDPEAVGAAT